MKAVLPQPVHESYQRHRKQRTSQIILPVLLAALLFVVLVILVIIATANGTGDVGRWAAISTIWIAIPTCLMGFVLLALLWGLVYLMGKLLGVTPTYTNKAQNFLRKLAIRIRLVADKVVSPIIALNGYGATIKTLLGRK
ncbi:MAG TPA: YIP1 family protein [Anaerolineales bacterium]|nr:YIP1 family protein [Anaerolineales bacterium]